LVRFEINTKDTIKFNSSVDYYKSQVVSDIGTKIYASITTKYKMDSCKYFYMYEQNGNDFSITTVMNKQLYEIPFGLYQYRKEGADESETVYLQHKGLWYGYYLAVLDGLEVQTSILQSKSKSLGQVEKQNIQKQLAREIMNNKLVFRISKVIPIGGKLEISLSVIK
jgi:hypothetical protein